MKALMPDISDPSTQERLSPSAILLFANIIEAWGVEDLDAAHLLGDIPLETYRAFLAGSGTVRLGEELLMRISCTIGIYKAIQIVHGRELADKWVHLPNTNRLFNGSTPLRYMIQEGVPAMQNVRRLLDARAAGNY
jgi:hypothetical protein